MSILVITTGGTIGALPYADTKRTPEFSTMPPAGQDLVRDALGKQFSSFKARVLTLEHKDSKLIDETYRQQLLRLIEDAPENEILITHGTDTVLQTAEFFFRQYQANDRLKGKAIILTGAMIPLANGPESDGYLNLDFALEQLRIFANTPNREGDGGVYIVLCDFQDSSKETNAWYPHLYRYAPGLYEKIYAEDTRFSRLRKIA